MIEDTNARRAQVQQEMPDITRSTGDIPLATQQAILVGLGILEPQDQTLPLPTPSHTGNRPQECDPDSTNYPNTQRHVKQTGIPKKPQNMASNHNESPQEVRRTHRQSNAPNFVKQLPPNVSFTRIDLKSGSNQPGLGPQHIEDLGLHKEDIGLKEKVILKDYPSPTRGGPAASHHS